MHDNSFLSRPCNFNCGSKIWTVQPAVHPICRSKNQRRWRRWRTCLRGIEAKMSDCLFLSDISCCCDNCGYLYLMFDVCFVWFFVCLYVCMFVCLFHINTTYLIASTSLPIKCCLFSVPCRPLGMKPMDTPHDWIYCDPGQWSWWIILGGNHWILGGPLSRAISTHASKCVNTPHIYWFMKTKTHIFCFLIRVV